MGLSLKRNGGRAIVGLDIDGAYLAAVEACDGRIVRAVSADLAPALVAGGEVNDAPALTAALRDFFKRHELPRRVRLGVANHQIAVRSMDLPPIEDESERAAAVRFQAQDAIAMPIEETVLDYQVVGERTGPEGTPRVRVVVAAARESMITTLVDAVRAAPSRDETGALEPLSLAEEVRLSIDFYMSQPGSPAVGELCPLRPRLGA